MTILELFIGYLFLGSCWALFDAFLCNGEYPRDFFDKYGLIISWLPLMIIVTVVWVLSEISGEDLL